MQQVHLQLSDKLYQKAKRRSVEAGFASVDEYIVEVVAVDLETDLDALDRRFTPKVIAELDTVSARAKAGGKTYTQEEVDEHFRNKSKAWRESNAS